jgi:hypothetical protein
MGWAAEQVERAVIVKISIEEIAWDLQDQAHRSFAEMTFVKASGLNPRRRQSATHCVRRFPQIIVAINGENSR